MKSKIFIGVHGTDCVTLKKMGVLGFKFWLGLMWL